MATVVYEDLELPYYVLPILFLLMWYKIINYLSVFKPTRYLIKMIFEIISDISTFMIIMFTALFAYAQIYYVIDNTTTSEGASDFIGYISDSYVLSLGELGDYDTYGFLKYFTFMIFSFLVPLVLLNMLIAIMSDSYSRV